MRWVDGRGLLCKSQLMIENKASSTGARILFSHVVSYKRLESFPAVFTVEMS